jgi:hypothetical protein
MDNRFLVTATRVIFVDDATAEELNAAKLAHPGKTIVRAATLYIAPSGLASHQTESHKELQDRVRKLERTVSMLVEAANDINKPTKTTVETVTETVKPVSPIAAKIAAKHNAKVKAEPKPAPVIKEEPQPAAASARIVDKYSGYDKDELLRRVKLRGGNAKRIMGDLHARARTNALRDWLRANPPKPKADKVTKPSGKKAPKAILSTVRKNVSKRRAAH